ncbi:MAG: hypothetical protein ACRDY1_11750, partial [Acidimicrobiales bacterium]
MNVVVLLCALGTGTGLVGVTVALRATRPGPSPGDSTTDRRALIPTPPTRHGRSLADLPAGRISVAVVVACLVGLVTHWP